MLQLCLHNKDGKMIRDEDYWTMKTSTWLRAALNNDKKEWAFLCRISNIMNDQKRVQKNLSAMVNEIRSDDDVNIQQW